MLTCLQPRATLGLVWGHKQSGNRRYGEASRLQGCSENSSRIALLISMSLVKALKLVAVARRLTHELSAERWQAEEI